MKTIHTLPSTDRPREKLLCRGAQSLSDIELLAIMLGSGAKGRGVLQVATRLLQLLDQEGAMPDPAVLSTVSGIGPAKAALIAAALEFARRRIHPGDAIIAQPADVYPLIRHVASRRREHFLCVSLNGANAVIAIRTVSVGLVNRALVHPREVYADPITDRAAAVIVAHNHPSGNLAPSRDDLSITRQLRQAGETLGIALRDHIIFNAHTYYSLMEHGELNGV